MDGFLQAVSSRRSITWRFKEPLHVFEACAATSCAGGSLATGHCFKEWTSGDPWKSHLTRGLGSCQYTEKTAAFSFINRSPGGAAIRAIRGLGRDIFRDGLGDSGVPASRSLAYT
jgi:hypothetical protein